MNITICSDCALLAGYDGRGRGSADTLLQRLQAPVAGLVAIPHHSQATGGLSIVQVNIYNATGFISHIMAIWKALNRMQVTKPFGRGLLKLMVLKCSFCSNCKFFGHI